MTAGQKTGEKKAKSGSGDMDAALGIWKQRRHWGAKGSRVKRDDDGLLSYVGAMLRAICTMADKDVNNSGVFKDKVKGIVKEKSEEHQANASQSIVELKRLLRTNVEACRLEDGT